MSDIHGDSPSLIPIFNLIIQLFIFALADGQNLKSDTVTLVVSLLNMNKSCIVISLVLVYRYVVKIHEKGSAQCRRFLKP
jgi:hypothetical protein